MTKRKRAIIIISITLFIFLSVGIYARLAATYIIPAIGQAVEDIYLRDDIEKIQDLRQRGKYEEALLYVEKITEKHRNSELYNEKGCILISLNRHEEGIEALNTAIEIDSRVDSSYNNLSWAYNELGEYEKALKYIDKSLSMDDNSSNEYVNKGNALYGLSRYQEAIKYYELAIEKNPSNSFGYYGRGISYYELGQYKKAIDDINKSNELDKEIDDVDLIYILDCYKYLDDTKSRDDILNTVLAQKGSTYTTLDLIATSFDVIEDYEKALEYYQKTEKQFLKTKSHKTLMEYIENPDEDIDYFEELLMNIGYFNYYLNNYQESLKYYNLAIELNPDSIDSYLWNVYNLLYMEKYEEALDLVEFTLDREPNNEVAYNALGNVYLEQSLYEEAINYFDKAIMIDSHYEDAYVNKLYCLFNDKQYNECIKYGKVALRLFPDNLDGYWYMADSYSFLYNEEKAIEHYLKALELSPDNETILLRLGWEHYYLQKYSTAQIYADKVLNNRPDSQGGLGLKNAIIKKGEPLKSRVAQFVKENYLYINDVENLEGKIEKFESNNNVTPMDIYDFVEEISVDSDIFTFALTGEEYDLYHEYEDFEAVGFSELDEEFYYIGIASFNNTTYARFSEAVNSIEDTKNKKLIIDLRGNGGGNIKSANDILDLLLSECVTSTLSDENGTVDSYLSNPTAVEFKEIFVFVDEYSASGSELLALGLKKYLNNVTIVGKTTLGKGVGQVVFDDKSNKVLILLVSFYWNVKEENILGKGIVPDILTRTSDINEYFDAIR